MCICMSACNPLYTCSFLIHHNIVFASATAQGTPYGPLVCILCMHDSQLTCTALQRSQACALNAKQLLRKSWQQHIAKKRQRQGPALKQLAAAAWRVMPH